ncbi:hypothetical protein KPSA1_03551 [Pseudomonas syringae pv. actinidiae]|uniref:Uncharacterized protein n=1 Tax=Pseudomonas syringae pv. actinidiae TaxID=103796 RepID=A0A2V0QBA9_PSESF|nr:hypothetical protein KPSA1_03551 [Pseudomonas syringae pv. actinidiae]
MQRHLLAVEQHRNLAQRFILHLMSFIECGNERENPCNDCYGKDDQR